MSIKFPIRADSRVTCGIGVFPPTGAETVLVLRAQRRPLLPDVIYSDSSGVSGKDVATVERSSGFSTLPAPLLIPLSFAKVFQLYALPWQESVRHANWEKYDIGPRKSAYFVSGFGFRSKLAGLAW